MKNLMFIFIGIIALSLYRCTGEQFQTEKEYTFSHIEIYCDKDVSFEQLNGFIPANSNITTTKEFKTYLEENIDEYSFQKQTENGIQTVYTKNELEYIYFAKDETATLLIDGEIVNYTYEEVKKESLSSFFSDSYALVGATEYYNVFTFKDGELFYTVSLVDGFEIRYIFQ